MTYLKQWNTQNRKSKGGRKGLGEGEVVARELFTGSNFSPAGSGECAHNNIHMVDNIVLYTWKSLGG